MNQAIAALTTVALVAALANNITISAPSSAKAGGSMTATGSSTAGESETSVLVTLDGVELDDVDVTWNETSFEIVINPVPERDPESDNEIVISVSAGTDVAVSTATISP